MPRAKQTMRLRRRIEVLYGPDRAETIGYSGNLSATGIMIRTPRVFPPRTLLVLALKFGSEVHHLKGMVVWAREGPVQWVQSGRVGMGIKFINPPETFLRALQESAAPPARR